MALQKSIRWHIRDKRLGGWHSMVADMQLGINRIRLDSLSTPWYKLPYHWEASCKEWKSFGIHLGKWWVWESKSETILETGSVTVSNENCMATYAVVGCGENWVLAAMQHVGIQPGGVGEVGPESKCWLLGKLKTKVRTTLGCHHWDISNVIWRSLETRGSAESQHVNEGAIGKVLCL